MATLFCSVGLVGFAVFDDPFGFILATSVGFGVLEGFTLEVSLGSALPSGCGGLEFSFGFTGGVGTTGVSGLAFTSGLGVGFATPGILMIFPGSLRVSDGCVVVLFGGAVGRLCFTGMGGAGNASLGSFAPGCDWPKALMGILMISNGLGPSDLGEVGTVPDCPVPPGINRAEVGSGTATGLEIATWGIASGVLGILGP